MWEYQAALHKVVDADTLDLKVDLGFKVEHRIRVRLEGVNAPEKNTTGGMRAIAALIHMLQSHEVYIQAYDEGEWPLYLSTNYDKTFDRYVGRVRLIEAGIDVSSWLIDNGFGVPYVKKR